MIAALPNDAEPDVDGGELVNRNLEVGAWVMDVALADHPTPVDPVNDTFRDEQLVEGHTTFVTVDIAVRATRANGTVNVTGYVQCSHYAEVEFEYYDTPAGNAPVFPSRVNGAGVECRVGERVFATPDPFFEPDVQSSGMQPTGRVFPFTTPRGEPGVCEEYVFTIIRENEWGDVSEQTLYAYSTPVFAPWIHADGRPKSFLLPLPTDRLSEAGMGDFTIVLQDDPGLLFAS